MATSSRMKVSTCQKVMRTLLCVAGLALSSYALYVETAKESDSDYSAMCDVSEAVSCSKVFTSKYGRGFGLVEPLLGKDSILNVPNSIYGLVFYIMQFFLGQSTNETASLVLLLTAVLANLGSVYLGYILYFILNDACLVCLSTYVVNALLLVLNVFHRRAVNSGVEKKTL